MAGYEKLRTAKRPEVTGTQTVTTLPGGYLRLRSAQLPSREEAKVEEPKPQRSLLQRLEDLIVRYRPKEIPEHAKLGAGLQPYAARLIQSASMGVLKPEDIGLTWQPETTPQKVGATAAELAGWALPISGLAKVTAPIAGVVRGVQALGKAAPLAARAAQWATAGAIAATPEQAIEVAKGKSPEEAAKELAKQAALWGGMEVAMGGIVEPALRGLARLVKQRAKPRAAEAPKPPAAEAKPPEAPAAEIKPPEAPTAEVKPPETKVAEIPPARAPEVEAPKVKVPEPPKVRAEIYEPRVGDKVRIEGSPQWGVLTVVDTSDPSLAVVRRSDGAQIKVGKRALVPVAETPAPAPKITEVTAVAARPWEGLRPGTEQWMKVWRSLTDQPEMQRAMAEYGRRVEALAARPMGATSKAKTERGTAVDVEWAVVDADDLVASHDIALRPDPRFPAELQPRERARVASEEQVSRIAAELEPEFLGASPKASEGAPIVGPDAVVESGNARVIALKRLYEAKHPNAEKYRRWLEENAEKFGIKPEAVQTVQKPVLVRVRRSAVDRPAFVLEANEPAVAAMSATEQAMADARRLPGEMLDMFHPDEAGNILVPENRDFVRAFMERVIPPAEHGRYMTAEGTLSQEGVTRIRNAVLAKAYGDPAVLAKLVEDPESHIRNIATALLRVAPRFAKLKEGIARGFYHNLDLTPELNAAVRKIAALRESGQSVEAYLKQLGLLDDLSPLARSVLEELHANSRSSKRLAELLGLYADEVARLGPPTQMFPELVPTKEQLWQQVVQATKAPVQQPVFFAPPGLRRAAQTAGPTEPAPPIKRRQIIRQISEGLSVPIRVGRYRAKALGIYKVKPEVIRTKAAEDMPTVFHEVGHHLDKLFDFSAKTPYADELLRLAEEVQAKGPKSVLRAEGVAEYVRRFLDDPVAAKKAAPQFAAEFDRAMAANPDVAQLLERVQQDYAAWKRMPAEQRVLSAVSVGEAYKPRPNILRALHTKLVDELAGLKWAVAQMAQGERLKATEDPFLLAWAARGWAGKAESVLHYGFFDETGKKVVPGLAEILRPVKDRLDELRAYLVAKHGLEVAKQGKKVPFSAEDMQATVKKYEPEFAGVAKKLTEWQDALVNMLIDAGLVSEDAAATMRAMYSNYVPFYRVIEEQVERGVTPGTGRGFVDLPQAIKRMKGSERTIIDPLESMVKNAFVFTNLAERNKVARALLQLAERKEGMGRLVETGIPFPTKPTTFQLSEIKKALVEAGLDIEGVNLDQAATIFRAMHTPIPRENIVMVWRKGQPELMQVHPDIYIALKMLDRTMMSGVEKLLSYPAALLRAGATLNPEFILRNLLRDQFTAFVFSKYGYVPGFDLVRGLFHVLRKDELYQKWMASGGAHATLVSLDRDYLQRNLRQLLGGQRKLTPLDWLQTLSEAVEEATRIGEFSRALKKWGDTPEGRLRAALASRDITVDFSRAGTEGKRINRWAAFFNANVQGVDKVIRAFKEDPIGCTIRTAIGVTLPTLLLYAINHKNPRYRELSDYERDMYWHVPRGESFVRLPKPFELGILFGTFFERVLEWISKEDPKALEQFLSTLAAQASPNILPTALVPILEITANKSFLTGQAIVPQREMRYEPALRYGPYTSETAKLIGKALNVTPRYIDQFIRGWGGGVAQLTVKGLDAILRGTGVGEPPVAYDPAVLRALWTKPSAASSDSIAHFYDIYEPTERRYATLRALYERGEPLPQLSETDRRRLAALPAMRAVAQKLEELRRLQRQVMYSDKLTPEEKERVRADLELAQINLVRQAFGDPLIPPPGSQ